MCQYICLYIDIIEKISLLIYKTMVTTVAKK